MKKILLIIPIILATIYSAFWFGYASYAKKKIVNDIEAFVGGVGNESKKQKIYQDISISGFPDKFTIKITDLSVGFKTGELIKRIIEKGNPDDREGIDLSNMTWEDDITFKGEVFITSNLLLSKYSIYGNPEIVYNGGVKGENNISTTSRINNFLLKFNLSSSSLFQKYDDLTTEEKIIKLIENFEHFSFSHSGIKHSNNITKELLSSSEESMLLLDVADNKKGYTNTIIQGQNKNIEFKESFDQLLNSLFEMSFLKSFMIKMRGYPYYSNFAERGISNNEVDLTLSYPSNMKEVNAQVGSYILDLRKFSLSDDLRKISSSANINIVTASANGEKSDDENDQKNKVEPVDVKVNLDIENSFSDKWRKIKVRDYKSNASNSVSNFSKILANAKDSEKAQLAGVLLTQFLDVAEKILKQAEEWVPHMHELGDIEYSVDVNWNKNEALKINKFNMITDLYGLKMGGKFDASTPKDFELSMTLLNYRNIVDDFFIYTGKIVNLVTSVMQRPVLKIKEGVDKHTKEILASLSDSPNQQVDDITITMNMSKVGTMDLGSAFMSVLSLAEYFQYIPPKITKEDHMSHFNQGE